MPGSAEGIKRREKRFGPVTGRVRNSLPSHNRIRPMLRSISLAGATLYAKVRMRRLSAIALFAALVFPAFLPFLAAPSPEANLPACCRRDGRHHCAMMAMASTTQQTTLRQEPAACPYRSQSRLIARTFSFHPTASLAHYAGVVEHPAIHSQTIVKQLVSKARAHQKRGPPSSSIC